MSRLARGARYLWRSLRWLLLLALILGLLIAGMATWILNSDGGRDWLLARVIALLPAGSSVEWERMDGRLSDSLDVHGLRFAYDDLRIEAKHLRVQQTLWPLLSGRLQISRVEVDEAKLVLAPSDEPFELPRWPDILPALDMPVTLVVESLQVRRLSIIGEGKPRLRIERADGRFTLGDGMLDLPELRIDSDRGPMRFAGFYRPHDNYRTQLRGDAELRLDPNSAPSRVSVLAAGHLDDFRLQLQGQAPAPLSAVLRLRDGSTTPRWSFDAKSERLRLREFGFDDDAAYAIDLHGSGTGGRSQWQGLLQRDDFSVRVLPSRLRLEEGVVSFEPLLLELAQGPVRIDGQLHLEGEAPRVDLRLRSDRLHFESNGENAMAVDAGADLQVGGLLEDWNLRGSAQLHRDGQTATLTLEGRGDRERLNLSTLKAQTPNGRLDGKGRLQWSPTLAGSLDAKLAGFDPGYFLPDYPGAVSGDLSLQGERLDESRWRGQGTANALRGQLRGRALSGEARFAWNGDAGNGETRLSLGNSRVDAHGTFGARLDLRANFSPLDLSDLFANAGGRLQGRVDVQGTRQQPSYRADLQGNGLHWGNDKAERLGLQGELPAHGAQGQLNLFAEKLQWSGQSFERVDLRLGGSVAKLQLNADVVGEPGRLQIAGSAEGEGWNRRGSVQSLHLVPTMGPDWTLRAPADYRWQNGALSLSPACLRAGQPGGEICAQADGNRARVDGERLPLALLQPWLDRNQAGFMPFGELSLQGEFARTGGAWGGRATVRSSIGGLRIDPRSPREIAAYRDLALDAELRGGEANLSLSAALAQEGHLRGRLRTGLASDSALSGELDLDMRDISWLELFSIDLASPTGRLSGQLQFGGRRDAPVLSGEARLVNFAGELPALGVTMTQGEFVLRGAADGQTRLTGHVMSGQGQLNVDGSLDLSRQGSPLRLKLQGENITIADTPDLEAVVGSDLDLAYEKDVLTLRGSVTVPRARVELERLDSSVDPSPDVVVLDPRRTPSLDRFQVDSDLDIRLGNDVRLRGFGLDGRLGGSLRLRDRPGHSATANGTLTVRGKYAAYGQSLTITQGRLGYANAAFDNPVLDIRAEREFDEVTAGVRVRGTALAPETTVYSNPALPPSEALAWLVLGRPLSTASGSEAQSLNASALALSAGSNLLAQQLGTRLGLDEAGISESRALGGSTLSIGKRISPRLFVSYGVSLIGTGQVITLKYLIRRGLDVSIETGNESSASLNWRKEK